MKGLMLTTPGGSKFWHPCSDPAKGLREMQVKQDEANTYGAAWGHPGSQLEYGESDGKSFTAERVLKAADAGSVAAAATVEGQLAAVWPASAPASPPVATVRPGEGGDP